MDHPPQRTLHADYDPVEGGPKASGTGTPRSRATVSNNSPNGGCMSLWSCPLMRGSMMEQAGRFPVEASLRNWPLETKRVARLQAGGVDHSGLTCDPVRDRVRRILAEHTLARTTGSYEDRPLHRSGVPARKHRTVHAQALHVMKSTVRPPTSAIREPTGRVSHARSGSTLAHQSRTRPASWRSYLALHVQARRRRGHRSVPRVAESVAQRRQELPALRTPTPAHPGVRFRETPVPWRDGLEHD